MRLEYYLEHYQFEIQHYFHRYLKRFRRFKR
jgi:hypothetical protein